MDLMLANKTILITGSSSGIGAATARLAKGYGANVILHGRNDSEEIKQLAGELQAQYIICDVADEAAVFKACEGLSKVDGLVNCAGIGIGGTFFETKEEEWLELFKVNVLGTVHFCKAVIPIMQRNGKGNVVNIASIRGFNGTVGKAAYSSTKAAISNITASLAKDFAPAVRINAVAPGFTKTDMSKLWTEKIWALTTTSLLGRAGEPHEIGEAICFLLSDRSGFIVGQTILVDGGYSISNK
jgi:NAD(P)-dependent dehydrogenase (short-subunit alcohol dehydrogenase family)